MSSASAAAFRKAVEAADLPAIAATMSPTVTFLSPVLFRPFEGRDAAVQVLGGVLRVFEDFRYTAEFASADGHVLLFEANVDELSLQGVDILRTGEDGLVESLTVMLRPYTAVTRVKDRMAALLGY